MDFQGFRIKTPELKSDDNCLGNGFYFKLAVILNQLNGSRESSLDLIKKCRNNGPLLRDALVDSLGLDFKDETAFQQFLAKYQYDLKLPASELLEHYRLKSKEASGATGLIVLLDKIVQDYKKEIPEPKLYAENKGWIEEVDKVPSKFLGNLIRALVYARAGNAGKAKICLSEIILADPDEIIFEIQRSYFHPPHDHGNFVLMLAQTIKILHRELDRPMVVKLLANYLFYMFDGGDGYDFRDDVDAGWSLAEIKKWSISPNFGPDYAGLWYIILQKKVSEDEAKKYVAQQLEKNGLSPALLNQLWVFVDNVPVVEDQRQAIVGALLSRLKSDGDYEKYLAIKMVRSSEGIKKALGKERPDYLRAEFQIEREFYLSLLNRGKAVEFDLFHLMRLGNLNENFLWWTVF